MAKDIERVEEDMDAMWEYLYEDNLPAALKKVVVDKFTEYLENLSDTDIDEDVIQKLINEVFLREALKVMERSKKMAARLALAQRSDTDVFTLADLLYDEDIDVVVAAIENPELPEDLLEEKFQSLPKGSFLRMFIQEVYEKYHG